MPLAARLRPRALDEVVGQEHLLGEGRVLRRALEADRVPSMILWGPPGSGKTTLAEVIARGTHSHYVALSAVTAGVAELRKVVEEARRRRRAGQRTILFVDEVHRWTRSQQDAILPHVEDGTLTLIGATTENPSFEVNAALLSRSRVFPLRALAEADIAALVARALDDPERGLGGTGLDLQPDALAHLVTQANGDARTALNALELAADAAVEQPTSGARVITLTDVEEALQHRALLYDRVGEQHFDTISAFIKSIRGSDPDAAIYWLARMLEAGEDVMFVARRLVILAGEDVGLADPGALPMAVAAQQAAHMIGLPEALYPLAEATLYLATAPKSNSVKRAYDAAREAVQRMRNEPVPLHLRNAPTTLARQLGHGRDYVYPHDHAFDDPTQWAQEYLPEGLWGTRFYVPSDAGAEGTLARERLSRVADLRAQARARRT
ncbi:MAG: replication-associated recombination protein A [Chloroflexi bacterium]|nr:replication-associated recombination protein A [Chloroflexota bacterium]